MRYRTLTVIAAFVALLGTAGPALAHGDWDYSRRHSRWHERSDSYYDGRYSQPRYFWNRHYYGGAYRPYYSNYYSEPDCYQRPYWGGGWNGFDDRR